MIKSISKFLNNRKIAPYIFVSPFIFILCLFFIYPLISAVIMSFQEILPGESTFVGFDNYKRLINPTFFTAIRNSFFYMLVTLVILIPIPLILAVLLNSKLMIFRGLFQSILFLPALSSVVVAGIIFRMLFGSLPYSQMNIILGYFGHESISWLNHPLTAYIALLSLATWRWAGVNILYFLAGLQNIPEELYEASSIDGANAIQKFFFITLPLLRPITTYVLTISVFGGLAMFTESYMFWGANSPNNIGLTIVGYLYQMGIQQNRMGLACAVGIFLLIFTFIINFIQLSFSGQFKKWRIK